MRHYSAYSLTIRSDLDLPELPPAEGPADVSVTVGEFRREEAEFDESGQSFRALPGEALWGLRGVGWFRVRGGTEVTVAPVPGADPALLGLALVGPVLGLALHQRGYLVLHASAVAVGGRAVAILGSRGEGKSTLAATLHARGHAVIADDVAAIDLGEPARVLPGVPQVELWPDAVDAMRARAPSDLPRLHPDVDKRTLRVSEGFPRAPFRLERLYVLATGPRSAADPIRPAEAVLEMIRHWYCARFGEQYLHVGDTAAVNLRQCADLAERVPARRLSRPRLTWSAGTLADLVEADLTR